MHSKSSEPSRRTVSAPVIVCEPLPAFDSTQLEAVRCAFQSVTPCLFQQAWRDEEEAGFSPATVRTGWRENSLLVFAELADADIFNDATGMNQRTWELGDVFEMFFRAATRPSYLELHVTPGNQVLQLRYADDGSARRARETGRPEEFLISREVFHSRTWIENKARQWNVLAEIPAQAVCGSDESLENTQWHFSFGRYDYTRGIQAPVISSTSPHAQPDFHRQHEWGVMTFKMCSRLKTND
jgi:hypothetical protein